MKKVGLDYGDTRMDVELPDATTVIRYGETYTDPAAVDPIEATRAALEKPSGMPRLRELAGPGKKVVIGFPDRVKGGVHPESHRRTAIPMIIEELLAGGCRMEDITLLCAMGLHRKNTVEEWYWYLGKEIVDQFLPDRLKNHDAEAPTILDLGSDEMGNTVQINREFAECDIPIIVGHCAGNPYGGFSGGYKMLVTGHTTAECIGSHHRPSTMHRDDWLGASVESKMRKQFTSIGKWIEKSLDKTVFCVDAVIGQYSQVLAVAAGSIDEVERITWPIAMKRTYIDLGEKDPFDVLIMGLPRSFHYGPGMGSNPILMSLAIGGQLSRCWNTLHEGGVVIAASVCDGWFNEHWFPGYRDAYWDLQKYNSNAEFLKSADAHRISKNPDYLYQYSSCYKYHPFHAMSMASGGAIPVQRSSAAIVVGAQAPGFARGMGFRTESTMEAALKLAQRYVGKSPRILCTPECFSGGVPVHLH